MRQNVSQHAPNVAYLFVHGKGPATWDRNALNGGPAGGDQPPVGAIGCCSAASITAVWSTMVMAARP